MLFNRIQQFFAKLGVRNKNLPSKTSNLLCEILNHATKNEAGEYVAVIIPEHTIFSDVIKNLSGLSMLTLDVKKENGSTSSVMVFSMVMHDSEQTRVVLEFSKSFSEEFDGFNIIEQK